LSPENLIYWLNGYFELSGATTLNEQQVKIVKEHFALVLHKVTPNTVTIVGGNNPLTVPYVRDYTDQHIVKPPTDWTITSTNVVMDLDTHLTC
jgi:hypothetical protein